MMAVSNEEMEGLLAAKLTAMLGGTGTDISVGALEAAIGNALDDLARFRPKVRYELVNLVPGQQLYPVPEGAYNVLDVVFPDTRGSARDGVWGRMANGELNMYENHSLAVILAQKQEQSSNLYGFDWEYDIDEETVMVLPVPQSPSQMVMKLAYRRALNEVPARFMKPVEELAMAACLRNMAAADGGGITSIPIGIGSVSFDSNKLVQQADLLRASAMKSLGTSGAGVVVIG